MMKHRLLDLFCGAGGAGMGYLQAGFDVMGVDVRPQPRYPAAFVQADALEYLAAHWREFDAIHASPPCQRYTRSFNVQRENHPDLLKTTIALLGEIDKPFVVENVPGSESEFGMLFWNVLCGVQFGLKLFRHRIFGSNKLLLFPHKCNHTGRRVGENGFVCMVGHGDANAHHGRHVPADHRDKAAWVNASGIDWMNRDEMAQAIPPAYTHYLGLQLMEWC